MTEPNKPWPKGEFERRLKLPSKVAMSVVLRTSCSQFALRSNIGGESKW